MGNTIKNDNEDEKRLKALKKELKEARNKVKHLKRTIKRTTREYTVVPALLPLID